jgi:hypothetical protein
MSYPPAYKDALQMQDVAVHDALNPETTPTARATIIRAWEALERLKREMRGIPPLKAIDSPKWPKRARARLLPESSAIEIESKESLTEPDRDRTARPASPQSAG